MSFSVTEQQDQEESRILGVKISIEAHFQKPSNKSDRLLIIIEWCTEVQRKNTGLNFFYGDNYFWKLKRQSSVSKAVPEKRALKNGSYETWFPPRNAHIMIWWTKNEGVT